MIKLMNYFINAVFRQKYVIYNLTEHINDPLSQLLYVVYFYKV